MIADDYRQIIPQTHPWVVTPSISPVNHPTREEFEALKREVEEMKKKLKAAKKQDEEEGNPDCEMEEKVEFLRKIAELVGVDLEDVFDQHKKSGPKL
jgi:hypothetical protein